jgi:hypothetical protein
MPAMKDHLGGTIFFVLWQCKGAPAWQLFVPLFDVLNLFWHGGF